MEEILELSSSQIAKLLIATADNPDGVQNIDNAWGFGRMNIQRAMALLRNPNQPALRAGPV